MFASCSSNETNASDEKIPGLESSPKKDVRPIDVNLARNDSSELLRALSMSHQDITDQLGPHKLRGTSSVRISDSNNTLIEELNDELSIAIDKLGYFEATLDNSAEYGRHVIYTGEDIYLRPRYGKYHKRKPRPGESSKVRDEMMSASRDYFEVIATSVNLSSGPKVTIEGRTTQSIELSKNETSASNQKVTDEVTNWRSTASVQGVEGQFNIDEKTGVILKADFKATLSFLNQNTRHTMSIAASHTIESIGKSSLIEAPPDSESRVLLPAQNEVEEEHKLLKGLVHGKDKTESPNAQK